MKWIKYNDQRPEPGQLCYVIGGFEKNIIKFEEYTRPDGSKFTAWGDELFGCGCGSGDPIFWLAINEVKDITNAPPFPEIE